ncbi:hypothetical protein L593_00880 [Salinarchaeum sp. Harcht-Bsk1]|uniref:hypothetical protein n=1 Tax=Salinarchaeum sp. Harcht-Bsk1 TaxID=1333523 RepID=UPI0003422B91|nr:hypothetical protein [Salinarchaeum sp. Harcht-Bsk1]AGN00131.1 hypothetical protein L593_00880 [Salinarchaeum sp. Harcht-Bsk1]
MVYTLQYYDLVLIAVITPVLIGVGLGSFTPLGMPIAIVGLGAVSIAVMYYGLFVNGPVDEVQDLTDEVEDLA